MNFRILSEDNVFTSFLKLLNVKYTQRFSREFYNKYPYKYTLWGLSKMLSDYQIENVATRINNKNEIINVETPFIAHIESDFVIVREVELGKVTYLWDNKNITTSIELFTKIWTGVVLLAEKNEHSIEPGYAQNKKKSNIDLLQQCTLWLLLSFSFLFAWFYRIGFEAIGFNLLLLANLLGIYISYLLVSKHINYSDQIADKICSLFSRSSDCNDVLASEAAMFLGVFSWAEIGFGYFISNVFLLFFFPSLISYFFIIGLFALPYSLWSIWYQKVKVKQWCVLCLVIQLVFWINAIFCFSFNIYYLPHMKLIDFFILLPLYILPVLIIHIIVKKESEKNKALAFEESYKSLKLREDVFKALIKEKPLYNIGKFTSNVISGNSKGSLQITILSNPYCEPCAKIHTKVENLLQLMGDKVSFQYFFSSFTEELKISNKIIIAAYLQAEKKEEILRDWFDFGRFDLKKYRKKYQVDDINNPIVEKEFNNHEKWIEHINIKRTPTIFVNGYLLPEDYQIEDLKYFSAVKL